MSKVHDVDPKRDPAHAAVAGRAAAGRRKLEARHQLHQRRRHQSLQLRRAAHHRLHRLVAREHRLPGAGGREGAAVRRAAHGRQDGCLHAGRGRQLRRRLREGSRLHPPAPCSCCSTRAPRRTTRPGGPPKRPASTRRGASASVETTGLAVQALLKWGEASGTARKALSLPRVEERRLRHLGHHAGHHHGAARAAALHRKGRGRCARHGGDHAQRQAGREARR